VVVNITQQAVAGSTATTTVASTAATSGGTTTIQTIGQQIRGPRTTVALTVQAPGGNLLPVTQIQQTQQRFTSASLVAAPAGGAIQKGKTMNPFIFFLNASLFIGKSISTKFRFTLLVGIYSFSRRTIALI
jgi:hypothetical protein